MQCVNAIKAATKGKAPIVAIPVEGHAPACVKRSRLAAWTKRVTILSAEVVQEPAHQYFEYKRARFYGRDAEGPHERVEVVVPGARYLEIIGRDGRVKTRAKFALIDRRTAVKELAKWTEKERARHEKKVLLGVLSKDEQKALKLAKAGDLGEDMVPITVRTKSGKKHSTLGVAVTLAALAEYEFVVHREIDAEGEIGSGWSVTECISGKSAGFGITAQDAIAAACKTSAGASAATLAKIRETIEASRVVAIAA